MRKKITSNNRKRKKRRKRSKKINNKNNQLKMFKRTIIKNPKPKVKIFDNVKIICLFKFMDISLHINGLMIIEIEE